MLISRVAYLALLVSIAATTADGARHRKISRNLNLQHRRLEAEGEEDDEGFEDAEYDDEVAELGDDEYFCDCPCAGSEEDEGDVDWGSASVWVEVTDQMEGVLDSKGLSYDPTDVGFDDSDPPKKYYALCLVDEDVLQLLSDYGDQVFCDDECEGDEDDQLQDDFVNTDDQYRLDQDELAEQYLEDEEEDDEFEEGLDDEDYEDDELYDDELDDEDFEDEEFEEEVEEEFEEEEGDEDEGDERRRRQ